MPIGAFPEEWLIERFIKKIIQKSNTVLDIGANVGSHTLSYRTFNANCKIHAFEPQSNIFDLLKKNVEQNSLKNITLYHKAVGHYCGSISMAKNEPYAIDPTIGLKCGGSIPVNFGGVSLGVDGESIEMITIDSLNLDACDFIKCDVEGFESLVFCGAEDTISKFRPPILFEHNSRTIPFEMFDTLNLLKDVNISPFLVLMELGYQTFICPDGENIIAYPDLVSI